MRCTKWFSVVVDSRLCVLHVVRQSSLETYFLLKIFTFIVYSVVFRFGSLRSYSSTSLATFKFLPFLPRNGAADTDDGPPFPDQLRKGSREGQDPKSERLMKRSSLRYACRIGPSRVFLPTHLFHFSFFSLFCKGLGCSSCTRSHTTSSSLGQ